MGFSLETIVSWAKRKGFVYPNSEIYGGLANAWDFGPYGSLLKKNISDLWIKHFVQERDDIVFMDTAIIAHPTTWQASGHLASFADALIDDKNTGQRFRADKIIEDFFEKNREGLNDEDLAKKLGVTNLSPESWGNEGMRDFIVKNIPNNPETGKPANWTECRNFNLMLDTHLGPVANDSSKVYMRPETCQSLFTNFRSILDSTRMRIPFGLAQTGKAFRNEITPGQFLYRTREFEQMEIEYFVENDENKAMETYEQRKKDSMEYRTKVIEVNPENLRFKDHEKLAHYAAAAVDIEYRYPRGFGEIQGVHSRTDFDLKQHQDTSGKDMQYSDPFTGKRYIPRCVEASWGLGRSVMVTMLEFYDEESLENGESRVVVRFPKQLAPVKFAVLPLVKKDEKQVEIAEKIFKDLSKKFKCEYDDGGAIGKRYRRQDEIGTPFCITVDPQSVEDGTVTIRDRDSMQQKRVKIEELEGFMG
ncbi:MAG TPA: glycine--tRNA ligase [Candidatus Absconditabacterales bacterium]|nr:glycine--tRNA ligase [Candidatus Absconditabacterales bacterium]HOQ78670.1 glycine--tRNA ligase [Candidatus Absconditabacterales bacterium]HPK28033.1 glycine--tRNA ligase [Candidatus Absconditabacterales bacterium]